MWQKLIFSLLLISNLNLLTWAKTIESSQKDSGDLKALCEKLVQIWPKNACAYYLGQEADYSIVSFACRGNFSATERQKFLDLLYKHGYVLHDESYKLRDFSGTYLYKTTLRETEYHPIFFKIYVRQATALYPQMPTSTPQIVIFVNELASEKELANWQALGIPLVYSVAPFRNQTAQLRKRILEYGQEVWVTLRLESQPSLPFDGKVLTLAEALNKEEIKNFASELKKSLGGQVKGVSYLLGSAFVKNIYALRALLQELREEEILFFLEPGKEKNTLETARIMSFAAFQADIYLKGNKKQLEQQWGKALQVAHKNNYAIVIANAHDVEAQLFLQDIVRANRKAGSKAIRFLRISELPQEEN